YSPGSSTREKLSEQPSGGWSTAHASSFGSDSDRAMRPLWCRNMSGSAVVPAGISVVVAVRVWLPRVATAKRRKTREPSLLTAPVLLLAKSFVLHTFSALPPTEMSL